MGQKCMVKIKIGSNLNFWKKKKNIDPRTPPQFFTKWSEMNWRLRPLHPTPNRIISFAIHIDYFKNFQAIQNNMASGVSGKAKHVIQICASIEICKWHRSENISKWKFRYKVFVINMTLMLYYYELTWSREYQQKQDTFCCEKWELRSTNISPAVTQYLIPL